MRKMLLKREVLDKQTLLAQVLVPDLETLKKASLEFFMETSFRVGLEDRMPKYHASQIGGLYNVKIYAQSMDDALRFIQLINKYSQGEVVSSYIIN